MMNTTIMIPCTHIWELAIQGLFSRRLKDYMHDEIC